MRAAQRRQAMLDRIAFFTSKVREANAKTDELSKLSLKNTDSVDLIVELWVIHNLQKSPYLQYLILISVKKNIPPVYDSHNALFKQAEQKGINLFFPMPQEISENKNAVDAFCNEVDILNDYLKKISERITQELGMTWASLINQFNILNTIKDFAIKNESFTCEPPPGSRVENGITIVPSAIPSQR